MIYAKGFFVTFLTFIMVFTFIPLVSEISYATESSFNIAGGTLTVHATSTGTTVAQGGGGAVVAATPIIITGESTQNTVVIEADSGVTADVILQGVSIITTGTAIRTIGAGNVTIEINGTNNLQAGQSFAGLQKENTGNLVINDTNGDGSLTATGGMWGAGIGGGNRGNGSYITINGGTIVLQGGIMGAGIGGGAEGNGSYITINGGEITAKGGKLGAGIGGGFSGNGSGNGEHITINGGIIYAEGGVSDSNDNGGTGIGAGHAGEGSNISITGGTVTAIGKKQAAGIGGSVKSVAVSANTISISGGNVMAQGGKDAAGIGAGDSSLAANITISGGYVIAAAGTRAAGIGNGANGDANATGLSVTGSAIVHVAGGAPDGSETYGAGIGSGARSVNGAEFDLDLSSFTGKIWRYNPGSTAEQIKAGTALLFGYGAISVTTDGHGTAVASVTNAAISSPVALSVSPNPGYAFKEWQVIAGGFTIENNGFTMPGTVGNPGSNVAVKAIFEQETYTINFVNDDNTVLQSDVLNYGEMPVYTGETPTKAATSLYDYAFEGWSPAVGTVTESTTYTALYNAVAKNNQGAVTGGSGRKTSRPKEEVEEPEEIDKAALFANLDDLDVNAWYAEGVAYVLHHGIMKGMGDGKFVPGGTATRAQMAQILFNLSGAEKQTVTTAFSDVGEGNWFADSVSWVVKSGIAQGTGDRFGAKDPITREQLAVMLYGFAKSQGMDVSAQGSLDGYADSENLSSWAREAIIWAVGSEIIKGETDEKGELKLNAKAESTRAQIALIFQRFCERNKS